LGEHRIRIAALDRAGALQAMREVRDCVDNMPVCLDFKSLGKIEPLGMLLFAASVKRHREELRISQPALKFRAEGYEKHSYAAHMGFFQMFGLEFGRSHDVAPVRTTYEPIRFIDLQEIEREAADAYLDVHDGIEARSNAMARLLVQGEDESLAETLSYCLREIIRNTLEHARVGGLWYCAQFWPTKDLVELALLDQGIGIRASLARNPHVDLPTDEIALRKAVLPGMSGVAYKGAPKRRHDAWQNSGFGLYMISQIAGKEGEFFIGSGDGALTRSNDRDSTGAFSLVGTAISIRLRPSRLGRLRAMLDELNRTAPSRRDAGEIPEAPTASMSSMKLMKNFDQE
jgi:hypothetical protein